MPARSIETPLGWITLTEEDGAITALDWRRGATDDTALLREAKRQLCAWFAHDLEAFDLPLRPAGNTFQQAVWREMRAIPYGETREYGEIARALGAMPQPVGNACGMNSIAIIIPCHRVIGSDGKLTGYGGGLWRKRRLLDLEGAQLGILA